MTEIQFQILKRIQPDVIELTKEDYENRMGIRPEREESKKVKDVRQPMVEDQPGETIAPVPVGADGKTRKDLIEELKERGFGVGQLSRKTKQQLLEML